MPPNLTLKQRLANLSMAVSAPSPPQPTGSQNPPSRTASLGTLGAAVGKGKALLNNAPWSNSSRSRSVESFNYAEGGVVEGVDDILHRMIFQAGVDFEVVMNASAFPDPRAVSYDQLLSRILSYLDLFVESDYTVVFFAAGGQNTPSWNWVWKAYRSLSRKYRKNLKRLYIVHSSFFSKMLFSLAGAMISPKFFRKITYVNTLSALACHVPLAQIDIPPIVYSENLKHEKQINMPTSASSQMFGVPLEELMGFDGERDGLPRVLRDCAQYLRETGMNEDGLFRRSPSSMQLRQIREAYNRGQAVSLKSYGDPHLAAVLIKKFLRDLPEPIFPESTYSVIKRCPTPLDDQDDSATINYIRQTLLPELAPCTLIILCHVLGLLHDVSLRSTANRMDAHNLAIVVTPNLVSSGNPLKDVAICAVAGAPAPLSPTSKAPKHPAAEEVAKNEGKTTLGTVIRFCIQRYYEIFDEIADRSDLIDTDPFRFEGDENPSSGSNSPVRGLTGSHSDNEEIDDTMLVMRVGPSSPTARRFNGAQGGAPSAWNGGGVRSVASRDSQNANRLANLGSASKAKARSLLTPSSSIGEGLASRKGTLARGAVMGSPTGSSTSSASGTMRKSSAAGVSATGITATGFFTPPSSNSTLGPSRSQTLPPPPQHPMSGPRRDNGTS